MKIDIGSDLPEFQELMRKRAHAAPAVIQKAVIDATGEIFTLSREAMSELIYNQPIPTRLQTRRKIRGGKNAGKFRRFKTPKAVPAWRRTSTLLRNERYYFRGEGADITGVIDNSTPYAKARHDLDTPSPIDQRRRLAKWRNQARQEGSARARAIFRTAISTIINKP